MSFSLYIAKRYLRSKSTNNAINFITYIAIIGVILGSASLFIVLSGFAGLKDFTLQFSSEIDPDLNIGTYALDLYLNTDFNFDEKLIIEVRVLDDPPDWSVDPGDFEFSMNLIGILDVNGVISSDGMDQISAFVGDEVRGVVELEYNEAYDLYFVFLSIYSNQSSGEATITL